MARRKPADAQAPRPIRLAPALALGALITLTAAALALAVSSVFWLLVLVGAVVIVAALLVALSRAIRPAMRPQQTKYDHSWWTNVLGDTSTPHPGPAAVEVNPPADPETDSDEPNP